MVGQLLLVLLVGVAMTAAFPYWNTRGGPRRTLGGVGRNYGRVGRNYGRVGRNYGRVGKNYGRVGRNYDDDDDDDMFNNFPTMNTFRRRGKFRAMPSRTFNYGVNSRFARRPRIPRPILGRRGLGGRAGLGGLGFGGMLGLERSDYFDRRDQWDNDRNEGEDNEHDF